MTTASWDAVIVAAGSGERFGGEVAKQFVELGGRPIVAWAARAFRAHAAVGRIVIVTPEEIWARPPGWLIRECDEIAAGGSSRTDSVARGVTATRPEAAVILIHDGVRPFASVELIDRVGRAAERAPAVPTLPVVETIKEVDGRGRVLGTVNRARLRRAQTPQGFPATLLRELLAECRPQSELTDDAALCESRGLAVRAVAGDPHNIKITSPADLAFAEWLLETRSVQTP